MIPKKNAGTRTENELRYSVRRWVFLAVCIIREKYPQHVAEFIFAWNTGLRLSSQYDATYEMMDLTRNVLDIPRTKNDEAVHVPLNSDVLVASVRCHRGGSARGRYFATKGTPQSQFSAMITGSSLR
jgi:hypothetical protein